MVQTKVVFKVYTDPDQTAKDAFSREVDIFDTLGRHSKEVIVEYLGSFIQNGKRAVILEYANGGNLRDFFQTHRRSRDNNELIYFWTQLFKLSDAIYNLHNIGRSASGM